MMIAELKKRKAIIRTEIESENMKIKFKLIQKVKIDVKVQENPL